MENLAKRILKFIDTYAGVRPDWCEIEGIDEKYTSPDAYEMLYCANELNNNKIPIQCFSEWGSGGYNPYTSKEGKEEHDYLRSKIYDLINKK